MTYDEITKALPKLSGEQLADLEKRVKALRVIAPATATGKAQERTPSEDWLLVGLAGELASRGVLAADEEHVLRRVGGYSDYKAKAPRVKTLLLAGLGKEPRPAELYALGSVAARVLAQYISRSLTPSPNTLLTNVERIPQAIEAAFPGYMASGLLHMVVRLRK